jgi:hypothetical protein
LCSHAVTEETGSSEDEGEILARGEADVSRELFDTDEEDD